MLSLVLCLVFFVLFIFCCIMSGNYLLRSMLDHYVNEHENFSNINDNTIDKNIERLDDCSKVDMKSQEILNFQTGTNIPLSPNNYSNYIGNIYLVNESENNKTNKKDKYNLNQKLTLQKPKLLYDGIWESVMEQNNDYDHQYWNLTNGNIGMDNYWSDDLIRINKKIPEDFIDKSAVFENTKNNYFEYCNDTVYDVDDIELSCFPEIFTAGITENTPNN